MNKKPISHSRTVMSQIMLPGQANPAGNVHGGEIMKLMDNTAYAVARKHARCSVVTARVDELQFLKPIYVDNLTTCRAHLVFTGKTSMEVRVEVEVEDLETDQKPQTALTAYFTMVALDDSGDPTPVPGLELNTEKEKKEYNKGKQRYQKYKHQH